MSSTPSTVGQSDSALLDTTNTLLYQTVLPAPSRRPPQLPLARRPYRCDNLLELPNDVLLEIIRHLEIEDAARFALASRKASSITTPQLARLLKLLRAEPWGASAPEWTGSMNSFRLHLHLWMNVHGTLLGNLLIMTQKFGPKDDFAAHKAEMMLYVRPSLRDAEEEDEDEDEEWCVD